MKDMDWKAEGFRVVCGGAWRFVVCVVPSQADPRPTPDARARTKEEAAEAVRLIASVPALLAALESIEADAAACALFEGGDEANQDCTRLRDKARAALALAKEGA